MPATLKTVLHKYRLNLDNADDRKEYEELTAKLNDGRHWMNCSADTKDKGKSAPAGEIELETEHLFSNQWNTACGFRVFDWYEGIYSNKRIKEGHWLEITDEMREIRRNTLVCGYCGNKEPAAKGYVFCEKCLDSEYLKEDDLFLLRMLPVEQNMPKRPELTAAELNWLKPQYVERQTTGANSRNANRLRKQRFDIAAKRTKAIRVANEEAEGMIWLMDNNISIDNVIYYSHTEKFCFGWRQPVSDSVASRLLEIISEFPFAYEIKGESRNWEGY
jgi:hypothetical protein